MAVENDIFEEYHALRRELDEHCARLYALHAAHLQCKAGCDMCCMDFSVLPVEYHAIKEQAGEDVRKGKQPSSEGECPFLVNHQCVIYQARPMICRTQGLPLLFMGEENWELSTCELNFIDFDYGAFTEENTFPQDRYNSRLYMLNLRFIESLPGRPYTLNELIPLKRLFEQACSED